MQSTNGSEVHALPGSRHANSCARTVCVIAAAMLLLSFVLYAYCQVAWVYRSAMPMAGDPRP